MGLLGGRDAKDTAIKGLPSNRPLAQSLKALYSGDPQAAEAQVRQFMENPELLESWATQKIRDDGSGMPNTGAHARRFSWEEVPLSIREAAQAALAMAYLIETSEGEVYQ